MTLLELLAKAIEEGHGYEGIRIAHIAFADDGGSAFLSEIERDELVSLLEAWCQQQRSERSTVH